MFAGLIREALIAPKLFVQTLWFMLNTCFPSGSLEFGWMLGRGCPVCPAPRKDPGAQSQESFLEDNASAVFAQLVTRWLPRRGLSESCTWSPGLGPSGLFPLLVLLCILHSDKSQLWG